MAPRRTVFLDRDGVLNRAAAPGDYVRSVDELELLDGVPEAVRRFNDAGWLVVVVTNQRGVALGVMSEADLQSIHDELRRRLAAGGAHLDAIYYCPHAHGTCECRKPQIGMFVAARGDHPEIDFANSVVIGDSPSDMLAADGIGARAIWITTAPGGGDYERAASLPAASGLLVDGSDPARANPSGVPTSITGSGSR